MSKKHQTISFSIRNAMDGHPVNLQQTMGDLVEEHNRPHLLREIDEEKLQSLWRNGKIAWAEIISPTEWVEDLRSL